MTNRNNLIIIIVSTLFLGLLLVTLTYCKKKEYKSFDYNIVSYNNIPNITNEEIRNIEKIKQTKNSLSFGTILSSEAFFDNTGRCDGFVIGFCELLTDLFDIQFKPEILSRKLLIEGIKRKSIDFSNEMSSFRDNETVYFMSHPITERSLYVFNLNSSKSINNKNDLNELKIGFFEENVSASSIKGVYPLISFKSMDLTDNDDIISMMQKGLMDAFIVDAAKLYNFKGNELLKYIEIPVLIYIPVSLITANHDYESIISVMNKYIEAGGIEKIYKIFNEGDKKYSNYVFNNLLTMQELSYLDDLKITKRKIPVSLEKDNYPVCFYNKVTNRYEGVVIDILSEVTNLTSIEFDLKSYDVEIIPESLKNGEILIASKLDYPERYREDFLFSCPYYDSHFSLISKIEYPNIMIHQVINSRVGVCGGTIYEEVYNNLFNNTSNLKLYNTKEEIINALQKNEIDLFMASENIFMEMKNYSELTGFKININLESPIEEICFSFNSNESLLRSVFAKTQEYMNISNIGTKWVTEVYEYSRTVKDRKFLYISIISIITSVMLFIMIVLFYKNNKTRELYKDQMIKLSTIYDALPDLVYTKDLNYKYTSCNPNFQKFFGDKESNLLGKDVLELVEDKEQANRIYETDKSVIKEAKMKKSEEWHDYPDGIERLYENTKVPLLKDGKVVGLLGLDRDITDQRKAIDAAYEASRAKSNFLAKMSHEIRTPMNAIIGMTELALREKETDQIFKHILTVKQAGTHLLTIINDILDFSKIEKGKLEILSGDYYLSSLINDVISIIRMKLIDSQIRFAVSIDSRIPNDLYGDETRLRQILLNILTNAVKYTEKGYITFTVNFEKLSTDKINLIIEVMDSGRGIKQENIASLFNEYIQVDAEKNKGIEGIGLGLAITWSLVKAMGGDIKVYSEYNKGSIFTVIVPQIVRSEKVLAKIDKPDGKSVIIYERREIYAKSIIYSINNLGVKCTLVENDEELIDQLQKNKFDFLFISYVLLRKNMDLVNKYNPDIKIAVLTEFGEAVPNNNLNIISMPVYSISIANILNGIADSFNYNENNENLVKFTAPSVRVLIVDDINTNLKVAEGLMIPYKMKIDLCKSGKDAIQAVSFRKYDLIFMDHKMPEMDGIEATKIIREMDSEDNFCKTVPIIALTANAITGVENEFIKNGFNDFLAKPIDIIKLNTILKKWIPKDRQNTVNGFENGDSGELRKEGTERNIRLSGVNTEKGVFLSGGTVDNYLDTLSIFYKDGTEKINELNLLLETNDMDMYNIVIHALKSALANIGADELSNDAKELEAACIRADMEYIKVNNILLINKLKPVLNELKDILLKRELIKENGNKISINVIKPILEELMLALNNKSAGTVNKDIEELVKLTKRSNYKNRINDISELILIGEFEEAAVIIKNILDEDK